MGCRVYKDHELKLAAALKHGGIYYNKVYRYFYWGNGKAFDKLVTDSEWLQIISDIEKALRLNIKDGLYLNMLYAMYGRKFAFATWQERAIALIKIGCLIIPEDNSHA